MYRLLWLVVIVGCVQHKAPKDNVGSAEAAHGSGAVAGSGSADVAKVDPSDRRVRSIPRPVPPGPYVIRFDCFHSDMPFGKGSQQMLRGYDLGTKQADSLSTTSKGDDEPPRPNQPPPPKPTIRALTTAQVATIERALDNVLKAGSCIEEDPPSEGTPCDLSIASTGAPNAAPFYKLEKSFTTEADACSELVKALP